MVSYSTEYNLKINFEFECVRATETRFLNKRFPHSSIVMENIWEDIMFPRISYK